MCNRLLQVHVAVEVFHSLLFMLILDVSHRMPAVRLLCSYVFHVFLLLNVLIEIVEAFILHALCCVYEKEKIGKEPLRKHTGPLSKIIFNMHFVH